MHNLSKDSLEAIYNLMTRMSQAIESADWDDLMILDHKRRDLLKSTIDTSPACKDSQANDLPSNTDSIDERQQLTAQIIELDKQLLQTLKNARQQLVTEKHERSAQQNAAARYAQARAFT